jgi:hypothetical protein
MLYKYEKSYSKLEWRKQNNRSYRRRRGTLD